MLDQIVSQYLAIFPGERGDLSLLQQQLQNQEKLNTRQNFRGHLAAGGIVLSPDRQSVLMIHHNILNRWFQPGGHVDPDDVNPRDAARREVEEETGVEIAEQLAISDDPLVPTDIDTHYIPASPKKNEPEHYHHEFRYVFLAASMLLKHQEQEVQAAEWVSFEDPRASALQESIGKLRELGIIGAA